MAHSIAITLVVDPATPLSSTFGPHDAMKAAQAALVGAGFTVYTDGASHMLVATPTNEATPFEPGSDGN